VLESVGDKDKVEGEFFELVVGLVIAVMVEVVIEEDDEEEEVEEEDPPGIETSISSSEYASSTERA
tara:strand:- start:29 stop:226 length:198 start_codon:yes stop_codon:yes gene_type:complete